MSKYLLGGLSLTGISTGFMYFGERIDKFSALEEEMNISLEGEDKSEELLRRVGLECSGQYCWPSRRREFNVERDKREENLALGYGHRGKLRIHRGSEGYLGGFRFTVEGSNIPLYIRKFWKRSPVDPLEEYENYEIKKDGEKYYLSRTKNSNEGKILELGLPDSCVLPVKGENTCKVLHVEGVGFGEGLNGLVDGEASLTITKTEDESFSGGYKFTFTFPQDVTINERVIRAKSPTDFRLKRDKDGHLTLEKAWENEKELLDKVGLECGENGNCSLKSGGTLKIKKVESQEFKEITNISPGKIRLYKYDDDYFNGLRLQVEGENIGSGDNTLEEFETYEIKEKGDEYYLLLKRNSDERIKELLKYPCSLSTSNCNVSNERSLNAINFEGKGESTLSLKKEMVIITVSKAPKDDFPVGRKFTFNFPQDVTIGGKVVKAYSPTDFKLKKHDNGSLTLERAWTEENELIGKVGMSCGADGNCNFNNGELKVRKGDKELQISNIGEGKIKLYKDTSRYSNGLKFAIEGEKIGTGENVLEEFETYEIKDVEGKYYLVLKTKAEEKIKELLKFPSKCYDSSSDCNELSEEEFKAIKFEGKDVDSISLKGKKVKITVSKAPEGDFPFSRKFTFTFPEDVTFGSKVVKTNAPTDFKLKRHNNGDLSLEKAWANENDLIGKVGLECDGSNNCTIKNEPIKVRKDSKMIQISNLGEGKIKLSKDAAGYSNGLKFEIEGKNIGTEDQVLEEFETYEIKEDESGYYLGLKTSADEKIKELLNYPGRCSLSSCSGLTEEEIKKINFENKNDSSISIKAGQTVKITVSKAPEGDYILGRKFTLESPVELKISNSTKVKANVPTEFKIKRKGSSLSLEKAWTLNTLTKKVGLICSTDGDNICTITSGNLNVKKENSLLKDLSRKDPQTTSGKIKVIEDQADYSDGLKFQIQDGNINLSTSGGQTLVLEEFETYEIKNDGKNHYLERKTTALQGKWKALGLPDKCLSNFGGSGGCKIDDNDLKNIKFHGKDTTKSITTKDARFWLKTSSSDSLPKGIKVKVEVRGKEVKIPKENNKTMILWKDYETEFKIKDDGKGNYSLEGTVDMNEIVKKFGIENGDCDDEKGCVVGPKVNVYMSGTKYRRDAKVSDTNERITYRWGEMTKMKFSGDLVFRVPDKGIGLHGYGGDEPTKNAGTFNRIDKGTYEIKTYTVGSPNNKEHIPYLSKEEPNSYDTSDSFFNY